MEDNIRAAVVCAAYNLAFENRTKDYRFRNHDGQQLDYYGTVVDGQVDLTASTYPSDWDSLRIYGSRDYLRVGNSTVRFDDLDEYSFSGQCDGEGFRGEISYQSYVRIRDEGKDDTFFYQGFN